MFLKELLSVIYWPRVDTLLKLQTGRVYSISEGCLSLKKRKTELWQGLQWHLLCFLKRRILEKAKQKTKKKKKSSLRTQITWSHLVHPIRRVPKWSVILCFSLPALFFKVEIIYIFSRMCANVCVYTIEITKLHSVSKTLHLTFIFKSALCFAAVSGSRKHGSLFLPIVFYWGKNYRVLTVPLVTPCITIGTWKEQKKNTIPNNTFWSKELFFSFLLSACLPTWPRKTPSFVQALL